MTGSSQKNKLNDPILSVVLITNALEMFRFRKTYLDLQTDETMTQEQLNISQTNWELYLETYCKAMRYFDKTIH